MPLIFTQPYITYGSYDTNYASVALLMHMDGPHGSRTFIDEKGNPVSIVTGPGGNSVYPCITNAQSKFGGTSAGFDATSMLSIPHTAELNISTLDWTVEFWFRPTDLSFAYQEIVTKGTGFRAYLQSNEFKVALSSNNTTSYFVIHSAGSIAIGNWYHVAVVKRGNTYETYLNGVMKGSTTSSANINTGTDPIQIGAYGNAQYPYRGYIDELRISNGVARYNGNFAVPTEPFGGVA